MSDADDSPKEASANRTAFIRYLLFAVAGVVSAILMFGIAGRMPYIECHFWLGRSLVLSLGIVLVSTALAFTFRKSTRIRGTILALVIYFCVFQVSNGLLLFGDIKQYQSKQGRLGSSYSGDASVDDIIYELRRSLLMIDTRSEIKIEDCRGISKKESKIKASWQKNENVEDVLSRLNSMNAIVSIKVDTSGNPESLGFVHGITYTLWLFDKESKPSR